MHLSWQHSISEASLLIRRQTTGTNDAVYKLCGRFAVDRRLLERRLQLTCERAGANAVIGAKRHKSSQRRKSNRNVSIGICRLFINMSPGTYVS